MANPLETLKENYAWIAEITKSNNDLLNEAMLSDDPNTLIKAHTYYQQLIEKTNENSDAKSLIFNPQEFNSNDGYKDRKLKISYATMRRMANVPIIHSVISTRVDQVAEFCQPQKTKYDIGFVIKAKTKGQLEEDTLSKVSKKKIQELTAFILNCGSIENKWANEDSFEQFLRKFTWDSLVLDQGVFEVVYNRKGLPCEFFACDGATFAMADPLQRTSDIPKEKGHYPRHVQVYEEQTINSFYPWELCFGIRNPQTSIYSNGYGKSELEVLIQVVTWVMYGDTYNGNFFSKGSSPKGFMKVSGNVNRDRLQEFKRNWTASMRGVENAWRTPLIEAENFEWIDLQKSNRDMEFQKWQEYLIKLTCAAYKIDPGEIGFHLGGSDGGALFETNNASRLKYSKDKGLKPLLRFIQRKINKYIIEPLAPELEFAFVGLDAQTEEQELEADMKRVKTYMGLKELRVRRGLPKDLDEDDIILDNNYMQFLQSQQMGDPESNEAMDEEFEDEGEDFSKEPLESQDDIYNMYKSIIGEK